MISVEDARTYILSHFKPLEPERVPLLDALDRVLAEEIVSPINVPPHNNSAMDGYAVRVHDIRGASPDHPTRLTVVADLAAGYVPDARVEAGTAIRIMTGAMIPPGAARWCGLRKRPKRWARRRRAGTRVCGNFKRADRRGECARRAGEDLRMGAVILRPGTTLRPAEIGLLASVGQGMVAVHDDPRVAILATGDEPGGDWRAAAARENSELE